MQSLNRTERAGSWEKQPVTDPAAVDACRFFGRSFKDKSSSFCLGWLAGQLADFCIAMIYGIYARKNARSVYSAQSAHHRYALNVHVFSPAVAADEPRLGPFMSTGRKFCRYAAAY